MNIDIRRISAAETLPVRWPVLRPGFPVETAVFSGDEDPGTRHLGAFRGDELIGVASIYPVGFPERPERVGAWQLRGMAVMPAAQRSGVGALLLEGCYASAREAGGQVVWCNARTTASAFYRQHGWEVLGQEFDIPTVGPHFRMWREV